jgi:hypothetical protein
VLLVTIAVPQVSAIELRATLDGRPIRLDRVPSLNCHDFDAPVIRCFSTAELIAADIAARLSGQDTAGARLLVVGFVTVYQDANYGTPSFSFSSDEASLEAIGWNDRISSFRSFGAVGSFREHAPAGGFFYAYGSTTQIAALGPAHNDKFSAFYIN